MVEHPLDVLEQAILKTDWTELVKKLYTTLFIAHATAAEPTLFNFTFCAYTFIRLIVSTMIN